MNCVLTLLGLYRGQEGLAAAILAELGADRETAKANVVDRLSDFLGATNAKP
jgi:hypothetical protein